VRLSLASTTQTLVVGQLARVTVCIEQPLVAGEPQAGGGGGGLATPIFQVPVNAGDWALPVPWVQE